MEEIFRAIKKERLDFLRHSFHEGLQEVTVIDPDMGKTVFILEERSDGKMKVNSSFNCLKLKQWKEEGPNHQTFIMSREEALEAIRRYRVDPDLI